MTKPIGAIFVLASVLATGCGFGVGLQYNSVALPTGPGDKVSMMSKSITAYDATGILLAGAGTLKNRAEAERSAIMHGARAGEHYSYEVAEPVPGSWTSFSYSWGEGQRDDDDTTVNYWQLDLRTQLGDWGLGPVRLSCLLGATFANYTNLRTGEYERDESFAMMVPIGVVAAYRLNKSSGVNARLAVDPFGSLMGSLDSSDWFMWESGLRIDYRLFGFLGLYADGSLRKSWATPTYNEEFIAMSGVMFIWGEKYLDILKAGQ